MNVWVCTVCAFLVKADSLVNTKGRYVGRYKECLAQQESGAPLSKSNMYISGCYSTKCALIRPGGLLYICSWDRGNVSLNM